MRNRQLADVLRPTTIDEIVGQELFKVSEAFVVIVDLGGNAVSLQHLGESLGGQLRLVSVPAALEDEGFFHGGISFPFCFFTRGG